MEGRRSGPAGEDGIVSIARSTPAERAVALIRDAVRKAAEELGATIVHEPGEGYAVMTRPRPDDPLVGVQAARLARDVAITQMREYAEATRGAGYTWDDIGAALGIEQDNSGELRGEQSYL